MRSRFVHLAWIVSVSLTLSGLLFAQSGEPGQKPATGSKKETKPRAALNVTPEREAAVTTFVQRNHAELADLLLQLKQNQPAEYEQAVREIFRTTERMAQIRDRDPAQYELELAVWTAQSRVQLLAARLKMGATDDLRKQLREALAAQGEAKVALLKHERRKAADRLGKLENEIARFETDRDQVIDKQLEALARTAGEGRSTKAGAKGAGKQIKKSVTAP